MGGSLKEHNERDFAPLPMGMTRKQAITQAKSDLANGDIEKMPHFAPEYLLDESFPPGNESFHRMTIDDVTDEYMTTTAWGKKHKKFHHKSEPFREAIVLFEEHHTLADFEALADRLESELDIQIMYGHLHRDEGHMNDSGEAVFNFHAHIGFTNLKNGKLNHFDNIKCARAQDICAEVLGMERGEIGSDANALDHREFRVSERYTVKAEKRIGKIATNAIVEKQEHITKLNKKIRQLLKDNSALAEKLDEEKTKAIKYQEASKATKDSDIEKLQSLLKEAEKNNHQLTEKLEAQKPNWHDFKNSYARMSVTLLAEDYADKHSSQYKTVEEPDGTRDLDVSNKNWEHAKEHFETETEGMDHMFGRFGDFFMAAQKRIGAMLGVVQDAPQEPQRGGNGITPSSPRRRGR